jgi:hypothetical protein
VPTLRALNRAVLGRQGLITQPAVRSGRTVAAPCGARPDTQNILTLKFRIGIAASGSAAGGTKDGRLRFLTG